MAQLTHNYSALHTVIENLKYGYKKSANNMRFIQQKRQTRKQLAELSDDLLKDIGLNYDQVQHEINKSFWTLK
ncbi:MAG: hypothetical protein ACJAYB_003303 [Psychromonas sp.]|jgi:uncharacterized protein YjiS (DUF1127 family)